MPQIDIKPGHTYRMTVSKSIELPASTAWVCIGDKVTVVGEWKDNAEIETEHRIYMVEWASDSFVGSGYRFTVRAYMLTE